MLLLEISELPPSLLDSLRARWSAASLSSKELVVFSRQFSTLVGAGVPIVKGLSILERQAKNPPFQAALAATRSDIEAGLSISEAIARHPAVFPTLYVSMVKAGELGGMLDVILERLSLYLERSEALKNKVKSALAYPGAVLGICILVAVFLLIFVIPTFEKVFASLGAPLPWITRALIGTANAFRSYFPLFLAAPPAALALAKRYYASAPGRRWVDGRLLSLPLIGPLAVRVAVAKLARTLGTLVKSGVPMLQALETVAATAGNAAVSEAVLAARESIRQGGTLSEPLERARIFPEMVVSMIGVGEETGALDAMLAKIADFYDEEVEAELKALTSLIEPLVMVVMGIVVGTMVAAMFLPMLQIPHLI